MRQPPKYTLFEYVLYTIAILVFALPIEYYEYRSFGQAEAISIGLIIAWFVIAGISYALFYYTKKNPIYTTVAFGVLGFIYEFFVNPVGTAPWLAWIITWIFVVSLIPAGVLWVFNQYFEPD